MPLLRSCTRTPPPAHTQTQVSYTRKAFGQTGDGHFSPIGGYHSGRDLVLILDTVRASFCDVTWAPNVVS
jgi:glutathione gamma-glutamylcysteinyltransferase